MFLTIRWFKVIEELILISRHNEESLGEMYRKDDIDVSNHEHTAPVYFQALSLD